MIKEAALPSLSTLSAPGRKRSREYSICCWSEQNTPRIGFVLSVKKIDEPASRSFPEGHGQSYLHPISLKSHNSGEGQMQAHLTVTGELVSFPEQASEKVNIHHLSIFNIY